MRRNLKQKNISRIFWKKKLSEVTTSKYFRLVSGIGLRGRRAGAGGLVGVGVRASVGAWVWLWLVAARLDVTFSLDRLCERDKNASPIRWITGLRCKNAAAMPGGGLTDPKC